MITITDSAGHSLTLDDVEMTSAEVQSRIEDWKQEHNPDPVSFTFERATWGDPFAPVHRPAPTSARWEGPPPRRARR